ncbi:unnamed protein product [Ilex paraguariensis]|uniref:Ash family protein n=1 Tax=Ilex paraguariensis TaxID=185542 RepID=A0ABC8TQ07_9AQUA
MSRKSQYQVNAKARTITISNFLSFAGDAHPCALGVAFAQGVTFFSFVGVAQQPAVPGASCCIPFGATYVELAHTFNNWRRNGRTFVGSRRDQLPLPIEKPDSPCLAHNGHLSKLELMSRKSQYQVNAKARTITISNFLSFAGDAHPCALGIAFAQGVTFFSFVGVAQQPAVPGASCCIPFGATYVELAHTFNNWRRNGRTFVGSRRDVANTWFRLLPTTPDLHPHFIWKRSL